MTAKGTVKGKVVVIEEGALPEGAKVIVTPVADAYLAGDIDREEAEVVLGKDKVKELDQAIRAIEHDVGWATREKK